MKANSELKLIVITTKATNEPVKDVIYGDSEEALSQKIYLNGEVSSIKGSMIARARRVKVFLTNEGVSRDQIEIELGSHKSRKMYRGVTFRIITK